MELANPPCGHCGAARRGPAGPCPRCGDDPAENPEPLYDPARARRKAMLFLGLLACGVVWGGAWLLKRRPPPAPELEVRSADLSGGIAAFDPAAHPAPPPAAPQEPPPAPSTAAVVLQLNPFGAAAAAAAGHWRFMGWVLDLETLEPVRGAELALISGRSIHPAKSDAKGRFELRVPAEPPAPYFLVIKHPKYLPRDFTVPAQQLQKKKELRLKLARNPDGYDLPELHAPWQGGTAPVWREIYLIRDRAAGKPKADKRKKKPEAASAPAPAGDVFIGQPN